MKTIELTFHKPSLNKVTVAKLTYRRTTKNESKNFFTTTAIW